MDWFSSDWHLGHHRIISHDTDRSHFTSIEEHDELILSNFEKCVQKNDRFYFLGDLSFYNKSKETNLFHRMLSVTQNLFFISGNHDHEDTRKKMMQYGTYLGWMNFIKYPNMKVTLNHYPMRSWDQSHRGQYLLHGHEHGGAEDWGKSLDVCVNKHDFKPWSLVEIDAILSKRPIKYMGHHTGKR